MVNLKPDIEKMKEIPVSLTDESNGHEITDRMLTIDKETFSKIEQLAERYNIKGQSENLAVIYNVLKTQRYDIETLSILQKDPIGKEQKGFFNFLNKDDTVKDILFKTHNGNNFHINDPSLIFEIVKLIQKHYPTNYSEYASHNSKKIKQRLARNMYDFLIETGLSKNKSYVLIGRLFYLSGLKPDLFDTVGVYDSEEEEIRQKIKNAYFKK